MYGFEEFQEVARIVPPSGEVTSDLISQCVGKENNMADTDRDFQI